MQGSRWSCTNAEFNKNILKYRSEIPNFAYVSLQEQNLRNYLFCYFVIAFKTNSQTDSVAKESSGTLDTTLESRASKQKF